MSGRGDVGDFSLVTAITSGRIVESLDQISRRFLGETTATTMGTAAIDRELVPAAQ